MKRVLTEKWEVGPAPPHCRQEEKIITKDQIFPEIIKFVKHLDEERAKKLLRGFNLNQLV